MKKQNKKETKYNQKLLDIGHNIFNQMEKNKNENIIVRPEDMSLLFQYIFYIEKELDKYREKEKGNKNA